MAFHANGKTVLIASQNEGSLRVADLDAAEVLRTVPAGQGIETLSFFQAPSHRLALGTARTARPKLFQS
ncbi:MAG: hypothetical protein ACRYGL_12485 [Janthinobacterium lividum]